MTDEDLYKSAYGAFGWEEPTPKANILDRISMIFGSDEWSDEVLDVLQGNKTPIQALGSYVADIPKNIIAGIKPGLTKEEVYKESGKGKELAEELGLEGAAATGVGLLMDVATPSLLLSFVPGGQVSAVGKGKSVLKVLGKEGVEAAGEVLAKESRKIAEKVLAKVPEKATKLVARDAFVKAFTSPEIVEEASQAGLKLFRTGGTYLALPGGFHRGIKIPGITDKAQKALQWYAEPLGAFGETKAGRMVGGKVGEAFGGVSKGLKKMFSTSAEIEGAPGMAEFLKEAKRTLGSAKSQALMGRGDFVKDLEYFKGILGDDWARKLVTLIEKKGGLLKPSKQMLEAEGRLAKLGIVAGREGVEEVSDKALSRMFTRTPEVKAINADIKALKASDEYQEALYNWQHMHSIANKKGMSIERVAEDYGPEAEKALNKWKEMRGLLDDLKVSKLDVKRNMLLKEQEKILSRRPAPIDWEVSTGAVKVTEKGGKKSFEIMDKRLDDFVNAKIDSNNAIRPIRVANGLGDVGGGHVRRVYEGQELPDFSLHRSKAVGLPKEYSRFYRALENAESVGLRLKGTVDDVADAFVWDEMSNAQVLAFDDFTRGLLDRAEEFGIMDVTELTSDEIASGALKKIEGIDALKDKYAIPEVADAIQNVRRIVSSPEEMNAVIKAIDGVGSLFKQYVTSFAIPIPTPGKKITEWKKMPVAPWFFGRNFLNNSASMMVYGDVAPWKMVQRHVEANKVWNYMEALQKEGYEGAQKIGSKMIDELDLSVKDILEGYLGNDLFHKGLYAEEVSDVLGKAKGLFSASNIGTYTEEHAKLALFIDQLGKGKSSKEAADMVRKVLFDYADLTDFEKNVMRRIFPFYTWTKKNLELQFNIATKDPRRMALMSKSYQYLEKMFNGLTDEERASLDPWMRDSLAITFGRSGDRINVITNLGTSYEAMTGVFGTSLEDTLLNLLGLAYPYYKIPLEQAFQKSAFRKMPLYQDVYAGEYRNFPDPLKAMLGVSEIPYTETGTGEEKISYRMPANKKYWSSALASPLLGAAKKYYNAKEVGLFPTIGGLFGFKSYTRDVSEMLRSEQERRLVEMQREVMKRKGLGREYANIYMPKEQRAFLLGESPQ